MSQHALSFEWVVCPVCQGPLLHETLAQLTCEACERTFAVYQGIPDFRAVGGYTQGTWREEAELLPPMLDKFDDLDLHGLLEEMLAGLEGRDAKRLQDLRDYFVYNLAERARHRMRVVELITAKRGEPSTFNPALEIGCGAGATLFEWAKRGPAVGIDPNLLHLLIAKKHAQTLNLPVRFACGFAEHLPFRNDAFSFVHFTHTCEHFSDQPQALAEVSRILMPGGMTCFDIPNRFSLWREPHTKCWGIGFLPRRWTALHRIHNLPLWRLKRLVRDAFGPHFRIDTMLLRFQVPGYQRSWPIRLIAAGLRIAESIPGLRQVIRGLQPGFEVLAHKREVKG